MPGEGWRTTTGMFLVLAGAAVALLQPWPLKLILDSALAAHPMPWPMNRVLGDGHTHSPFALVVLLSLALLAIELVMGLLNVLSVYLLVGVGLRMVFKLRCAVFDHVQRLSLAFHDSSTIGDSLYRVTWDTYCVQAAFNTGLVPTVSAAVTLAGIAAIMFSRDWLLTLAAMAVAVPLVLLIRRTDAPMSAHSTTVHDRESRVSTRVEETLAGIRAVQAFGREAYESGRFRSHAHESLRANLRLTLLQTALQTMVSFVLAGGTAAVVALAAWRVLEGRMTPGDVVLLAAYVAMLFKPLETLAYTVANFQGAAAGARRVFAILDTAPDVADAPGAIELPGRPRGHIQFQSVTFGYRRGQPVLDAISVGIPAGATVALVGTSGAGKTTLSALLLRFYDPWSGRITLDGVDLRDLTLQSLRRNVALVLQEPLLFSATVRENIAYGRGGATDADIAAAATAAGAMEFIQAMPQRFETQVGERGVLLSGGQRQRIAIARAFLKDAPVLIMDEPTSAMDAQTESRLLETMKRLARGRTTLIIAHRLSTVRDADQILVLDGGSVVEAGAHSELIGRAGHYARLCALQFGPSANGISDVAASTR
jgi:ATP-binding cassette subfamily B protein/subfamily B ATP-binding cassette protein MsbA